MTKRFVLAIDGGGVRGLVAAVLLDILDGERRAMGATRPLGDCFDLIAGASTGAIIAAGLAAASEDGGAPRRTPAELRDLYRKRARTIFPLRFWGRVPLIGQTRQLFGPLYKAGPLDAALAEELGSGTFRTLRRNLMIPAYSIDPRDIAMFRGGPDYAGSAAESEFGAIRIADAVAGSCAAPTYFPPRLIVNPATNETMTVIDGGVYLNDPALAAVAEAATLFPGDDIHVVSIGTGRVIDPYPFARSKGWGFYEWLSPVGPFRTPLISVIADGQTRAVSRQLEKLLGDNYTRFDYDLAASRGSANFDDASRRNLNRLEQGALQMAERMRPQIRALAGAIG